MSFMLTTEQVKARTKTVTRRNRWKNLKAGETLIAVNKSQGLKKGEHPIHLAIIVVLSARWERLDAITDEDVAREGFPGKTPEWFVNFYCAHNGGDGSQMVHRIEFGYRKGTGDE
jgi:hypothetical protein